MNIYQIDVRFTKVDGSTVDEMYPFRGVDRYDATINANSILLEIIQRDYNDLIGYDLLSVKEFSTINK